MATFKEMQRRDNARAELEAAGFKFEYDLMMGTLKIEAPGSSVSETHMSLINDVSLDGRNPVKISYADLPNDEEAEVTIKKPRTRKKAE